MRRPPSPPPGLDGLGDRTIRELSMGQRRRALLAAAWIGAPRLVVLDEPLEAMDRPTRAAIVRWAAERRAAGAAVLVATHEVAPFADLVDDVLVVAGGRVARAPALPGEPAQRLATLEALAAGEVAAGEVDEGRPNAGLRGVILAGTPAQPRPPSCPASIVGRLRRPASPRTRPTVVVTRPRGSSRAAPAAVAFTASLVAAALAPGGLSAQAPFVVTDTSVRQGPFEAVAVSRDTIVSSYPRAAREVRFKFSIDGRENEFPPGTEHTIYLRPRGGRLTTPLYTFGDETEPPPPTPEASASSEDGTGQVTFRVDLRPVLRAIRERGTYVTPTGDRLGRGDVRAVYVVGDPAPLAQDYAALRPGSPLQLTDPDGDGIYTGTVAIETAYTRPRTGDGRAIWTRRADLARFPTLASSQRLQDALYRLSLEELTQLVRDDGALSAGAKWEGVWTRDVSLASLLSLALVAPDAVRRSLLAKVDSAGRIIQDTGTGGSWPVSSDRVVWALAAWELYAATGDTAWLRTAHDVTRRSAQADLHAVRDPATGLFRGETSFMDWREQSYPRWMQPADIYQSQGLSTNAAHHGAYRVLARMARALGGDAAREAARWDAVADTLGTAIARHFWLPANGHLAAYRYGRTALSLLPRSEGLGGALAVVTAAVPAARAREHVRRSPVVAFGTPSFWPYSPGERLYHNGAVWPFVTAYDAWAGAEVGNTAAVEHGLANATRAAALFLTNKENMVAATGHYDGTALNSDRQLWSVAGTLASTYRLLFGLRLEADRLTFRPMVPPSYAGERTLRGLRWRGTVLDVTVRGHGSGVARTLVDGRPVARAELPASLTGAHAVVLELDGRWPRDAITIVGQRVAPPTPVVTVRGTADAATLAWAPVRGAVRYVVHRDGRPTTTTRATTVRLPVAAAVAEYQVLAVDSAATESFLSEPVRVGPPAATLVAKPAAAAEREHAGFTGAGYVTLARDRNTTVTVPVTVAQAGTYAIDVRYANGSGPVNTDSKGALRTLLVDGGRPAAS
jgi:energy-coupling factor transporter ATP-binding protein EcfA2